MELGLGLITCQLHPDDPERRSAATIYAQALELAEVAERVGFGSLWVSEHHFVDDGYLPASLVLVAGLAARTSRIRLGTGVMLAPLFDPLHLAEDAAVADLVSGGRLILGLGLGWREEEFEGFGVPMRQRARRLEETVSALRAAFAADGLVEPPGVAVHPKPAQPGGPPIWIGGSVPAAVERAGRIADGFYASVRTLDELKVRLAALSAELPVTVSAHVPVFAWDGPEDPWSLVRDYQHYISWKYLDMADARARTGPPPSPPPIDEERDAALRGGIVVGRPDEVAEQLRAFAATLSDDGHLICRSYFPGMPWEIQRRSVAILGHVRDEALRR